VAASDQGVLIQGDRIVSIAPDMNTERASVRVVEARGTYLAMLRRGCRTGSAQWCGRSYARKDLDRILDRIATARSVQMNLAQPDDQGFRLVGAVSFPVPKGRVRPAWLPRERWFPRTPR
jgi:hypothetical protein